MPYTNQAPATLVLPRLEQLNHPSSFLRSLLDFSTGEARDLHA